MASRADRLWPSYGHKPAELKRTCLDIQAHSLLGGQDPRALILAYFGLRWSRDASWPYSQRIVIDSISVEGVPYRAGGLRK